ncbi:4-coumarate--CoA ligase-like 9 [Momordica charantia]|uniref:4-coumarate--CoA ligase-like 9 n=1 Tax=Momordica charantia TaxID=3673 RepID=A0A6J1C6X8_MOMCH|nr:4-coumarate--CoA ligase-like 9 [Momordica charantia]XP_022137540.1 4-coumarate--CoA ligase-like 9 [Momordica charantia]
MADRNPNFTAAHSVDPRSGFCPQTKIFHSLRPPLSLPPIPQPLSVIEHALTLLQSSPPPANTSVLVDSNSGVRVSYSLFIRQIRNLASNLQALTSLSNGQVAFILAPTSLQVPVLLFALLSLGVTISPANPTGSHSEIAHQVRLSKPVIAFATSSTAPKLPRELAKILIDSPEFFSMIIESKRSGGVDDGVAQVKTNQSDSAAILYSSGTTGQVKGVLLTHRNLVAANAVAHGFQLMVSSKEKERHPVFLCLLPLFHVFGFIMLIRAISRGDTVVLMQKFDFGGMLRAVEKYMVTYISVAPPLVVALAKSELKVKYDLSSLRILGCGGAPLGREIIEKFHEKFPNVEITQGYGLTESTAGASRTLGSEESSNTSSVGRLCESMEAKIVDPASGEALSPGHKGELWLRGPGIMKGYVGDDKATAETLHPEGWLRTGDLCYFDSDGFLYIVDRLKELIKYKAYQVPPAELEHLLQSNPEIVDAAVIPYPDEEAGEIPMAYVVRKPGSNITEAQVIDFVAKQVAPYKKIRRASFINAVPKSPSGKILRRELVKHALSHGSHKL